MGSITLRLIVSAPRQVMRRQCTQHRQCLPMALLTPQERPLLKRLAVFDQQTVQKLTLIEGHRLRKMIKTALTQLPVSVSMALACAPQPLKSLEVTYNTVTLPLNCRGCNAQDLVAPLYPRQRLFEQKQRLAQIVAGCRLILFGPKQRSQARALVDHIGFNG